MIRFLLLTVLFVMIARAFWKVVDNVIAAAGGASPRGSRGPREQSSVVRLVRDPVCGTHVAPRASLSLVRGGTTQYFCSEACLSQFRQRS